MDGSGVRAQRPDGGSYLFLDFAPVLDGRPLQELLERAIDRGVLLAPGSGFGDAFGTWARLCFTSVPRARLLEGVARLREAISRPHFVNIVQSRVVGSHFASRASRIRYISAHGVRIRTKRKTLHRELFWEAATASFHPL